MNIRKEKREAVEIVKRQLERITKKTWDYDYYYKFFHEKVYTPEIRAETINELRAISQTLDYLELYGYTEGEKK